MDKTGLKLEYLNVLRNIIALDMLDDVDTKAVMKRYVKTCDSIERDLGTGEQFNIGNLKVNVNVDTKEYRNLLEQLRKVLEEGRPQILVSPLTTYSFNLSQGTG